MVQAKNAGLHVAQYFEGYNYENSVQQAFVHEITPLSPTLLNATGVITTGGDRKVFVEKGHINVRVMSNANIPVVLRLYRFKAKRDIQLDTYPALSNLLTDGASLGDISGGDPLTSNAAQRMLKFGKMKTKILYPGKLWIFTIKDKPRKFMSGDIEGNQSELLYYKGLRAAFLFIDGVPTEAASGGAVALGPYSVQITHAHKVSWRNIEDSDNTSVKSVGWTTLSGFGSIVAPTTDVGTIKIE